MTPGGICSTTSIPCTGLDTEEVKLHMRDLAVEFFDTRLAVDRDGDGVPDATDNCPTAANGDQADTDTDGTGDACDPTPFGTTPPELTVPADFATDATGPAGATVTFEATATDDLDPTPTVTCTPASGSRFAIGATPVECVATDRGGNASEEKTFTRHRARRRSADLGPDRRRRRRHQPPRVGEGAADRGPAVAAGRVRPGPAAAPRRRLPRRCGRSPCVVRFLAPARAAGWIEDANRIRAVLAC